MGVTAYPTRAPGNSSRLGAAIPVTWRRRAASGAVWYLRLVALVNLIAVASAPFRTQLRRHTAEGLYFTPYLVTTSMVFIVLSLLLAVMMRRRKRAAWIVNLVAAGATLTVTALFLVVPDLDSRYRAHPFNYFSLAVTALFVAALLVGRREFAAQGDRSNIKLAAVVASAGVVIGAVAGTALVTVSDTVGGSTLGDRLLYTLARMVTLDPEDHKQDVIAVPGWTDAGIHVISTALLALVLYVCFRAPRGRELLGAADEQRLRELLGRYGGGDSLGYFALRRDKSAIWSSSGKSAVVYRVVGGVSLASGDPIGDVEAWPGAIDRWLAEARAHGWAPAVVGASETAGLVYARHGLGALELGDEAIVDHADFTLEGRAMRGVRQARQRIGRAGYTVRIRRHGEIGDQEMADLVRRADQWRDGPTERGFSMALGRLGDPSDRNCLMVECRDADGELRAVLSFVPWGSHGLSLDLMRRERTSDNGLVEFMVTELLLHASEYGVDRVSLNFAMFRSVFERGSRLGAGPVLRLWRSFLTFFSRWWQIESLYRANAKYRPAWEPRFVLFSRPVDLPQIAVAAARAEGFLGPPHLPELFRRRHRPATRGA